MMLLGIFKNANGEIESNLYFNWDLYFKDTFSPSTEILTELLFKIKGKTYEEKKENLRQLAIDFQTCDNINLSWGELADILNFFEINGKRYGLLREFKENCIV